MEQIKIIIYKTKVGRSPFFEWLETLDHLTRAIIRARLERISIGNIGDIKPIKGAKGLYELRIFFGPGYRVYATKKGQHIIIILAGGAKGNQERDIVKAKRYLIECED